MNYLNVPRICLHAHTGMLARVLDSGEIPACLMLSKSSAVLKTALRYVIMCQSQKGKEKKNRLIIPVCFQFLFLVPAPYIFLESELRV